MPLMAMHVISPCCPHDKHLDGSPTVSTDKPGQLVRSRVMSANNAPKMLVQIMRGRGRAAAKQLSAGHPLETFDE